MQSCIKDPLIVEIGARPSALSKAQVNEVLESMRRHHPTIEFHIEYISTIGDRDQTTSLRSMERTDFFTREIDAWILQKEGRVGIHSAKDLPMTLAPGLSLFCLTEGIDPSDSLVLRKGETLQSLSSGARIATSSIRREESVRLLRNDFLFCDLRGTIEQRLHKLETGEADGIVVAEAALLRLNLTHLNRINLPYSTVDGQGRLAIVGHQGDQELKDLFSCIHFFQR